MCKKWSKKKNKNEVIEQIDDVQEENNDNQENDKQQENIDNQENDEQQENIDNQENDKQQENNKYQHVADEQDVKLEECEGTFAELYITTYAKDKMLNHINRQPKLECGGMLIGNVAQDPITEKWIGKIDDVYFDDSLGTASNYVFKSSMQMDARKYCIENYRIEWIDTKHIIGNYHSHGTFDAFFSSVDEQMMRQYKSNSFYIVYSPSYNKFIVTFMDEEFKQHNVIFTEIVENKLYKSRKK